MTTMAPEVEEEASGMEDILQVFRIFKLARVLKLARHSPGELLTYFHIIINKFLPQIPFINSLFLAPTGAQEVTIFFRPVLVCLKLSIFIFWAQIHLDHT